jgi:hypothetical protein
VTKAAAFGQLLEPLLAPEPDLPLAEDPEPPVPLVADPDAAAPLKEPAWALPLPAPVLALPELAAPVPTPPELAVPVLAPPELEDPDEPDAPPASGLTVRPLDEHAVAPPAPSTSRAAERNLCRLRMANGVTPQQEPIHA